MSRILWIRTDIYWEWTQANWWRLCLKVYHKLHLCGGITGWHHNHKQIHSIRALSAPITAGLTEHNHLLTQLSELSSWTIIVVNVLPSKGIQSDQVITKDKSHWFWKKAAHFMDDLPGSFRVLGLPAPHKQRQWQEWEVQRPCAVTQGPMLIRPSLTPGLKLCSCHLELLHNFWARDPALCAQSCVQGMTDASRRDPNSFGGGWGGFQKKEGTANVRKCSWKGEKEPGHELIHFKLRQLGLILELMGFKPE